LLAVWEPFLAAGTAVARVLSAWGEDKLRQTHFIFNPHGQGWHLDRLQFDAMLAEAAAQAGACVHCGADVTFCRPAVGDGWEVEFTSEVGTDRRQHRLRSRFLVDATGRAAVLARRQGAKRVITDRLVGLAVMLSAGRLESPALLTPAMPASWWRRAPMAGGIPPYCPVSD
jgi:flavin-dependent dehydrogenase